MNITVDKKTFVLGVLTLSASILLVANILAPRGAVAMTTIYDKETYQLQTGRISNGGEALYVKGRDRVLIVFRGGRNDGRKALTLGERMWLIVPGAEHPVPITANQRLMGGASFGDVARLRFADDFDAAVRPRTEKVGDRVCRVLDLTARSPKAAFPKVTLWIDAEGETLPRKVIFKLPSGKDAREVTFTKFTKVQGKTAVAEMEIRDLLGPQSGTLTRLEYLKIEPAKIDDKVFTPEGAKTVS